MSAREIREDRIKDVIAKHVPDEEARSEIWSVIEDAISDERSDAYDDGWFNGQEACSYGH